MANRVLILRWAGSAYDSLGGLLELTGHELAAQGLNVTMFAADGKDWPQRLIQLLRQGGISFALTMSGIGTDLSVDGKLIWEAAKVPLFNWSCDHPCYFPMRHAVRNTYLLHGYVFPDHARYNISAFEPERNRIRRSSGHSIAQCISRGTAAVGRAQQPHHVLQERG
jgi:hypothetical protein